MGEKVDISSSDKESVSPVLRLRCEPRCVNLVKRSMLLVSNVSLSSSLAVDVILARSEFLLEDCLEFGVDSIDTCLGGGPLFPATSVTSVDCLWRVG